MDAHAGSSRSPDSDRPGGVRSSAAWLLLGALLLGGAAASACGSGPGPSAAPTTTTLVYGQGALSAVYCTSGTGAQRSCGGLLPAPIGITDRIVLDHTVVATGTVLHGSLVVVNRSGHPISLLGPDGCQPSMSVAVTSTSIPPGAAFTQDCRSQPLVIARGETRMPIEVFTTYPGCSSGSTAPTSPPTLPACLSGNRPPPLPVGGYQAVLVGMDLALPPATVAVTLTR